MADLLRACAAVVVCLRATAAGAQDTAGQNRFSERGRRSVRADRPQGTRS